MAFRPLRPCSFRDAIARVRGAARVAWRHRGQLMKALWLLPVVAMRLRRSGYRETKAWLDQGVDDLGVDEVLEGASSSGDAIEFGRELAKVVRIAARLIPDSTCLRKSLVLQRLLADRGILGVLKLGVTDGPTGSITGSSLTFHAWLEVDDVVVSEPPESVARHHTLLEDSYPSSEI